MAGRLVVLDRAGRAKSKSFLLPSGMCTLGRSAACDIRVLLPTVSPHHATVTVHANQTVVRNAGSGRTLVNGEPVSVCALRHGDELTLGGRRLRWEYDAPAQPRRSKTEPALALPGGVRRAARRGTLAAPPRAPDRHVQLALELRHRASMPASSSAGGKQVAIVQPQRRDPIHQNDSSPRPAPSPGAASAPARSPEPGRSPEPAPAPPPGEANSARLHTPTKATLWIESRRGRARAASLRTATPLRLAVLRKALTPAARRRPAVTKIQAPLRQDQTKQAAIMLMTGHTPKSKLSPAGLGARRPPSFVARRSPAARRHSRGAAHAGDKSRNSAITLENIEPETPDKSARKSNARQSSKRSVSVIEITDSRSPAPAGPRKSALKSVAGPRKSESIKFDLSNLDSVAAEDEDAALESERDATLRYSHSPPSPSPRRSIHSRGGRMLESLGSPLRSPAPSPASPASPASPRSRKSARGSAIVRRALAGSSGPEPSRATPGRRRELEAYSVVDLVSLDSDASAYGSASPGSRSSLGAALLGCSTPLPPRATRASGAGRGRSRLDDSAGTIDSIDDDSPGSSRKTPAKRGSRGRLDESVPSESEDVSPDGSKKSRTSVLSTSNLSNLCNPPESPRSDVSFTSVRSARTPARGSRGRPVDSVLAESPKDVSPDKSRKSRVTLSTLRGSRSRLDVSVPESPKDVSPDKSRRSRSSTSVRSLSIRSLPIELSQSDVSLDSSAISQVTARSTQSTKNVSPDKSRKSRATSLSTTNRSTRSLPIELSQSDVSLDSSAISQATARYTKSPKNASTDKSRKSRATSLSTTNRSTRSLPIELSQNDVSLDSSAISQATARYTKSPKSPKSVSPDKSRRSRVTLSPSTRRTRSLPFESPRTEASPNKSRKSRATLTASNSSTLPLVSSQSDVSLDSSKKSLGKTVSPKRGSRSRLDNDAPESPKLDVSPDKFRKSRATLSTSNRRTLSLPSESPRSKVLIDSTRKSKGASKSPKDVSPDKSRKSRATLSSTGRSTRSLALESSQSDVSLDSPKKSLGKTSPKRDSRSRLDDTAQPGPSNEVSPDKSRKSRVTLSTSNRSSRNIALESSQSETALGSSRTSLGKALSPKRSSRAKVDEGAVVPSPEDVSPNKSRKSRASLSKSNRRTRSLPHQSLDSPKRSPAAAHSASARSSRGPASGPASPALIAPPRLSRRSGKSPSTSISSTPVASPKNLSSKSSRVSRKTLTLNTSARSVGSAAGDVTPERSDVIEEAGTPVLSIRSLLDASVGPSPSNSPPRKRGRPSAANKRKTFAGARGITKPARGSIRSKSLIVVNRDGDVTPTGASGPSPEAVKHKHSSAKKSRSRRSIIDTLDDSGLVRHLFGSPVKRKLSRSMTEFSRRHLEELEEPEPAEPEPAAASPEVSGVRRLFARKTPRNELTDLRGVRRLLGTPRARRSIKNDLTDVHGVKAVFAAGPRNRISDVRGVKRTFARSPEDDLRRVSGVRELFREENPRDDLTDVRGVRELFERRGPKNELVNVSGVKDGLKARSPNNDLRDVRGVRRLYGRSKAPPSPNMSGVARLLDEPAPAEVLFDKLVGRPPVRATYSKTFVARSIKKPGRRRRTTSLGVPLDVLVDRPEEWVRAELEKRAAAANRSVARALQQLATATVAGSSPLTESRRRGASLRRSAADTYAAHTLPIKKRSLAAAPAPREPRKRSLPLKKRALVHSTPVKGRASRAADETLARMSPIAVEPAVLEEPVRESPPVVPASPKEKPKARKTKIEDVVEKNESVGPSPKKTRAKRAEKAAEGRRATRGGKAASNAKKRTPKKTVVAKRAAAIRKTPTPKKSPAPKKAPATRRAPASPAKSPAPRRAAAGKPIVVAKTLSPAPAEPSRSKKPAPSPIAAVERRGRARAQPAAPPATEPVRGRAARAGPAEPPAKRARRAAGDRPGPDSPESGRKRATKLDAAGDAPSPAPRRNPRKTPPTPDPPKRGGREAPPAPKPKRGREAPPPAEPKKTPGPKRGRRAQPTPKPKKGNEDVPAPETKKAGRRAPSTPKLKIAKATPESKRGRSARREPKNASKPSPAPEPKRTRRAAAPEPEPPKGRKAPTVVAKKVHKTPESKKSPKAPPTPEPRRGRKAPAPPQPDTEPDTTKTRRGRAAQQQAGDEPAARPKRGEIAATKQPKPKGKKVATPVVEENATRGRKRKNDTASVEKKSEPSPKKPRATRAAAPAAAAAPARGRRR